MIHAKKPASRTLPTLATAWNREIVQRHHVADHEDLRVPGQGEIVIHLHAASPIDLAATLLCELPAER